MAIEFDSAGPLTEEVKLSRSNIAKALGIQAPTTPAPAPIVPQQPIAPPQTTGFSVAGPLTQPKPKQSGGIFDVPILGPIIGVLDAPRSFLVSTVKEVGDIFADGQSFSLNEWWDQANRHMMGGEVLRDWDVGPDGLEGFLLGLSLDVALDPLTYMAGLGLAARASKVDDVAKALIDVGRTAEKAGDVQKAERMFRAEEAVSRSRTIMAGGDALKEIGIDTGLRFTIPATGRLGRGIVERPLRSMVPRLGDWLDVRRVQQLAPTAVKGRSGSLTFVEKAIDTTDDVVQAQILKRMGDIRKGVLGGGVNRQIDAAARAAMNMPVEAFKIPFSTGRVMATMAGSLGKTWRGVLATKYGASIADGLSTSAPIRRSRSAKNAEERLWGYFGQEGAQASDVSAGIWKTYTSNEFNKIVRNAHKAGLTDEDFAKIMVGVEAPLRYRLAAAGQEGVLPPSQFTGEEILNPYLLELSGKYHTDAWIDTHTALVNFWENVGTKWNDSLPLAGVKPHLSMLREQFYSAHFIDDEGWRALKRLGPDDPMLPADKAGTTGLRGSATTGRKIAEPEEIVRMVEDNWGSFNISPEFTRMIHPRKLNLNRNVGREEFLAKLRIHLNTVGESLTIKLMDGGEAVRHNLVGKAPIKDPRLAGGLSARAQQVKLGEDAGLENWIDIFSKDPQKVFTRYVTQMESTLRADYMLDYFQEAGIVVKGFEGQPFLGSYDNFQKQILAMFPKVYAQMWDGTALGRKGVSRKYRGTMAQQQDLDRVAAEINDLEDALAWMDNPVGPYGGSKNVSAASVEKSKAVVRDLAQVEGLISDVTSAVSALLNGSMKGLSQRARMLLQGDEVVLDLAGTVSKKQFKEARRAAGLEVTKGLPKTARVKIPRPATKAPSTTGLARAFKNKEVIEASQEEAAQILAELYGVQQSLRAVVTGIQNQIKLVGKVAEGAPESIRNLWDLGEGLPAYRPRNLRDISQADDLDTLLGAAKEADYAKESFGVTPSQYLSSYQKRVERAVDRLGGMIDGMQSVLAKNIVDSDPTTITANLITDIGQLSAKVSPDLSALRQVLTNMDSGTLQSIRKSLQDFREVGRTAVQSARRGVASLPDPLTEDVIRAIDAALKGKRIPSKQVYAKNLPLDILEQLAVKMGPSAGGPLRQWVASVKQLEREMLELGRAWDTNLTPSINAARNYKGQLLTDLASAEEDIIVALVKELEAQVAKGTASIKNREAAASLEGWAAELKGVRESGKTYLEGQRATWQARLDEAVLRQADLEEIRDIRQAWLMDSFRSIKEFRSQYNEVLSSPVLKDRVLASETANDALKAMNDNRVVLGFADAWSEAAQKTALHLHDLSGTQGANISNFTRNKLRGYSLASDTPLTTQQLENFQALFQASAKMHPESLKPWAKNYLTLVNWWKAMAISTTGFIWRNTMGGFWLNNQIAGVPLSTHTRVLGIRNLASKAGDGDIYTGINKLIERGSTVSMEKGFLLGAGSSTKVTVDELRLFKEWLDTGVATSGQVSQEIVSTLDTMGAMTRREKLAQGGTIKPWKAEFYPAAGIRILNQDAEFMLRGAVAHHTMMTGGSVDDAFKQAEKFHFNYSDLTQAERNVKMAVPFWTWQKNIVPVLLESLGKNPRAWARLQQVKNNLEFQSDEEGVVPDFFAENMGMRTPWSFDSSRIYVLPDLPFRDLSRWLKEADSPQDMWKSPTRAVVESALPWFKLPIELWAGKQTFADIPITGRYQQAPMWARVPVFQQVLEGMGILKRNKKGQLKMRDNHIYMLDQFHPMFGRARRLWPNEEGKQERWFTTVVNTALGLGLRMNTPRAQRGQRIKDQVEVSQMFRDMVDLERREI